MEKPDINFWSHYSTWNQIITVHSHVLVNTVLTFPDMQDINILLTNQDHQRATVTYHLTCADLEGGRGGPDPPGICKA